MWLFENARLLDVAAGALRGGVSVLVEGERIVEVSERPIVAREAQRIDLAGRTLMPGLIDAHVHCTITTMNLAAMTSRPITLVAHEAGRVLERMLRRGFTTVRDAGGADCGTRAGDRARPHRRPAPLLLRPRAQPDRRPRRLHAARGRAAALRLSHPHERLLARGRRRGAVRKAAREELRRGATQVKIMASGGVASPSDPIWNLQYSPEEMRAIVEEAAGWRTYAMAHAYTPEAIRRAVDAGVRTIEHGNLIDAATAEHMRAKGAYLVPTLVTYFAIDELGRKLGFPAVSQAKVKDVLDQGLASLEIARAAGLPMGFGTDLLGETHDQQSREFEIRARVLAPAEVIRSATLVNAEILNRTGELGVIAPGALADLLVVDGDPLADLATLAEPEKHLAAVVKGGRFVVTRL